MTDSKLGTYTMVAFVLLGGLSLLTRDYATGAMNIAIGLAFGGSGQKPWDQQSPLKKFVIGTLLIVSVALFAYVIITDLSSRQQ